MLPGSVLHTSDCECAEESEEDLSLWSASRPMQAIGGGITYPRNNSKPVIQAERFYHNSSTVTS